MKSERGLLFAVLIGFVIFAKKSAVNMLREKSKAFAIRIVNLNKFLRNLKNETVISKQLLRSGTSVGANISESVYAQSKADFITKLHIALKEASETEFWIELLANTEYISQSESESLLNDCRELIRMLISSLNTSKKNQNKSS